MSVGRLAKGRGSRRASSARRVSGARRTSKRPAPPKGPPPATPIIPCDAEEEALRVADEALFACKYPARALLADLQAELEP